MFCNQIPLFTINNPIVALKISINCTKKNTVTIGSAVYLARIVATGITRTHVYTLSNKNVTIVFPPDLIVKYEQCEKQQTGITRADITIKLFANALISSCVLYI